MRFSHSQQIWADFPQLVPGVLLVEGMTADADVRPPIAAFTAVADSRLAGSSESELPEIQAWRRVFASLGLKPTQYRCAAESLLRRCRKEGSLPEIHPLIDLCNAVSLAFAVPVAVFDVEKIEGDLEVRRADGSEVYLAFSGEEERPVRGEVIFADGGGRAHARRWTHRQSALSAIRPETRTALIVAEGVHESANTDIPRLTDALTGAIVDAWSTRPRSAVLNIVTPDFAV